MNPVTLDGSTSEPPAGPPTAAEEPKCTVPDARPVCGAKLRGKDTLCQKAPMVGKTRCRLHGGLSLAGEKHGCFKHGMYAKAMPHHLRKTFSQLVADPNLLDGRAEVSILQMRLTQLTARFGSNESGATWRELQTVFGQFRTANEAGDAAGQLAALARLNEIITGSVNDEAAWIEATEFIERATKVAEREWKRVIANRSVATAEQVRLIVGSLTQMVLLYVKEPEARRQIADHVNRLRIIEPVKTEGASDE